MGLVLPEGALVDHGRYQIERVLGRGGFGVTYRAFEPGLDRWVAIKELFPLVFSSDGNSVRVVGDAAKFQQMKDRFRQEGRTLARLDHPHIVRVLTTFEENDTTYLVSEYAEGPTYEELLQVQGSLQVGEAMSMLTTVAEALERVHESGLLHRDVKPANIIRHPLRGPVLIDFGAARADASMKSTSLSGILTMEYAPPEQFETYGRLGPWTDVYGLGATAYHCLSGRLPPSAMERLRGRPLPDLLRRVDGLSTEEAATIERCLAVEEADRPQSMAVLLVELAEARDRARTREAEERARREAEKRARQQAEEQARHEARERAQREAEERAQREAEERARREAALTVRLNDGAQTVTATGQDPYTPSVRTGGTRRKRVPLFLVGGSILICGLLIVFALSRSGGGKRSGSLDPETGPTRASQPVSSSGGSRASTTRPVAGSGARFMTDATAIATGDFHSCALRRDATATCWGNNSSGQLGNGAERALEQVLAPA